MTTERRNVILLNLLEILWAFGAAFVTANVLAALIHSRGGGPTLMAVVTICTAVVGSAPQLLVPYLEQRIVHPVRGAALSQVLMVVGWGAIAVGLVFNTSNQQMLAVIIGAEILVGLGGALNYPFYQQMRMRLFPPRTRAKSYSTVLFSAQAAATVGAVVCVPVLNAGGAPTQHNYLVCYAIAGGMFILSTLCYLWLRDPHPTPVATPHRPPAAFLREYGELLRSDRNFRWFLASESFAWSAGIGATFVAFAAVQRFGENIAAPSSLARCIISLVAVPIAHYVVTRFKPRGAMAGYYVSLIASFVLMMLPLSRWLAVIAIALDGAAMIFRVNYLFHFVGGLATDTNRTRYFALTNAIGAPFMLIGPLLGAWLLKMTGNNYSVPFAVSIGMLCIGLAIVRWRLRDPTSIEAEHGVVPRVTLKRLTE